MHAPPPNILDAPFDSLQPGDAIVVTARSEDDLRAPDEHRVGIIPAVDGQMLWVVRVALPFVLAKDGDGRLLMLDTRRQAIARA